MAEKIDPLKEMLQRRAAERLATVVIPARAAEFTQERKQAPEPPPAPVEVKREEPTKKIYVPARSGLQLGPDTNRAGFQVAPKRVQAQVQNPANDGAAILDNGKKPDPLAALVARHKMMEKHADRPAVKLIQGKAYEMER